MLSSAFLLDRFPNHHVAFGRGPHRCIGMRLARLELRVILEEFLSRVPDFRVRRDELVRAPGITRQVLHLPVDFSS
jgi:cytochrome P450